MPVRNAGHTDNDEVLDERIYILQNWRHDVVALVTDTGAQVEGVRYSAYGIPYSIPAGDMDQDDDVDSTDTAAIQAIIDVSGYDPRADLNLSGNVNTTDKTLAAANTNTGGWGVLSGSDYANRKGYAGYEFDDIVAGAQSMWHVRHRVLNSDLGRWMTRDPAGLFDGVNVYCYVTSSPISQSDPTGRSAVGVGLWNWRLWYETLLGCLDIECRNRLGQGPPPNPVPCHTDREDARCERACQQEELNEGGTNCPEGRDYPITCCICTRNIENIYGDCPEVIPFITECARGEEESQAQLPCCMQNRESGIACAECLVKKESMDCRRRAIAHCTSPCCRTILEQEAQDHGTLWQEACFDCCFLHPL